MPRGTVNGGCYRMNHDTISRSASTGGEFGAAGASRLPYASHKHQPAGAFQFSDTRHYQLHDPLATLTSGGLIEHEAEGQFPLTSAIDNVPQDNVFLGCWAFALPDTAAALRPLPYIYWTVKIIFDVEWYAPASGVPAPSTGMTGVGAGLDATGPAVA